MKVDLLEKFKSSLEHLVDLIVRLEAVRDVIVDDHGPLYDSLELHAWIVHSCVLQVSIQVVKLVQVERVALVWDYIEEEALFGVMSCIALVFSFD